MQPPFPADAATAAGTIDKVLLVSSIVAIMWDWWERGRNYVYTEDDWTLDSSVQLNLYAYCKRECEKLAYQMADGQRWAIRRSVLKFSTLRPDSLPSAHYVGDSSACVSSNLITSASPFLQLTS